MRSFKFILLLFSIFLGTSLYSQKMDSLTVYFETDQFLLETIQNNILTKFISSLDSTQLNNIRIHAYCDDRGTEEYNLSLSQKRATSIQKILSSKGFTYSHSEVIGKGEIPLKNDLTNKQDQRKHNRRALIIVEYVEEIKVNIPLIKEKMIVTEDISLDKMQLGDKITLKNILFVGGMHTLLPESYPSLEELVNKLKENPAIKIMILGHICCQYDGLDGLDKGTGKRNLSVARAQAIYEYLIKNGIDENRLQYKGLKGAFPTGKAMKYDRRVEIQITQIQEELS